MCQALFYIIYMNEIIWSSQYYEVGAISPHFADYSKAHSFYTGARFGLSIMWRQHLAS